VWANRRTAAADGRRGPLAATADRSRGPGAGTTVTCVDEHPTDMPRDDRTHVEEWADLVGETVSEEVTPVRRDRRDRSTDRS